MIFHVDSHAKCTIIKFVGLFSSRTGFVIQIVCRLFFRVKKVNNDGRNQ